VPLEQNLVVHNLILFTGGIYPVTPMLSVFLVFVKKLHCISKTPFHSSKNSTNCHCVCYAENICSKQLQKASQKVTKKVIKPLKNVISQKDCWCVASMPSSNNQNLPCALWPLMISVFSCDSSITHSRSTMCPMCASQTRKKVNLYNQ